MRTFDAKEFRRFLPQHYKKRKVFVSYTDKVSLGGRYWDGGSKSEYCVIDASTGKWIRGFESINPLVGPHGEEYDLKENEVVVQTGTFCGKTATAHLFFHKSRLLLTKEAS